MLSASNDSKKNSRSEQARINGSKSRGPKTPQGMARAKSAPSTHGLYMQPPPAAGPEFDALRQHYQSVWNAENSYIADKINDLVAYRWELNHLRQLRQQYLIANSGLPLTESAQSALDRLDLRIRRCGLELSRIERDVIRTHGFLVANGGSQKLWETKEKVPEPTQDESALAWVRDTFRLTLDDHQANLLTARHPVVALNAARYGGKTTALALRAILEAIQHPGWTIACLSPSGDLQRKVAELAAIGGYQLPNITGKLSKSAAVVLIDDAADLTAIPVIHKQARIILAATPKGCGGYFHRQYHYGDTIRIDAPARQCRLLSESFLKLAQAKLSRGQYMQEFDCEFLDSPEHRCRLLPLTQ